MISIKSKKGENNLMLSETAMLIIVATILIIMLVILVRMYLIFEDPDVIASKQAYNRLFKAIESIRNDGDITYEYASLRNNHGILILNSETTKADNLYLFNPITGYPEEVNLLEEYKKGTPKICYVYTTQEVKGGKTERNIKINECKQLSSNLKQSYLIEQDAMPLIITKKNSIIYIKSESEGIYDPRQYNNPYSSKLFYSIELSEKLKNLNQLIDLEVENWFSREQTNEGTAIIEKQAQYLLKWKLGETDELLTNTQIDVGVIAIVSYALKPQDGFEDIEILKYEEQFVKLSSIDNIGKFENIEITKESTQMFNTDPQVLKLNALGDTPNNICVKLSNDHCIANMNYLFKKLYLYKMEKSGITIGFFILSDVDLTTENFKNLLGDVNFQNKVKELVCGEENIDNCKIF